MLSPGYSYDTAYVEFLNLEDAVHFMESNKVAYPRHSTKAASGLRGVERAFSGWGERVAVVQPMNHSLASVTLIIQTPTSQAPT